jgi:hypothetical protein
MGCLYPRKIDGPTGPVLAVGHQVPVRRQHERGVLMAQSLSHGDDARRQTGTLDGPLEDLRSVVGVDLGLAEPGAEQGAVR